MDDAFGTSRDLRTALVDTLRQEGHLRSARIAAAFQAVPREAFVPGLPLDDVYRSSEAIVVKRVDGVGVSSASAPDVMALMLEQLDVQPGMRVLEIGAGTGYNAALLGHLVGEGGRVVTVDIDDDLVIAARQHLSAAGVLNVEVIHSDGALGYVACAPFDRIMLTVASRDIAPAWLDQLARPNGRLLLPLRIRGPQRSIAFVWSDEHLASTSVRACGFIPLRGLLAVDPLPASSDTRAALIVGTADEPPPFAVETVVATLRSPASVWPSGVEASINDVRDGLVLWLAAHEPAMCVVWGEEREVVLPGLLRGPDNQRGTLGILDPAGAAILLWKNPAQHPGELCVQAPVGADHLALGLLNHVRCWSRAGCPVDRQVRIQAYPRDQAFDLSTPDAVVEQRWTRFAFRWEPGAS